MPGKGKKQPTITALFSKQKAQGRFNLINQILIYNVTICQIFYISWSCFTRFAPHITVSVVIPATGWYGTRVILHHWTKMLISHESIIFRKSFIEEKVFRIQICNYSILYIFYEKRVFHKIWGFLTLEEKSREKRIVRKKCIEWNSCKVEFYTVLILKDFYEK